MKKPSLTTVIATFSTATSAAIKVRFVTKPGVVNRGAVWIARSKIQKYRDLIKMDGFQYVTFECPNWILKSHQIAPAQLVGFYTAEQTNRLKVFLTNILEITHRRLPALERRSGKVDQNLMRIIQQTERYLEDEVMQPFPTTTFKDADTRYRKGISAYRKITMKQASPA